MIKRLFITVIILLLALPLGPALAQSVELPVYVVQSGDTLNIIAARFGISATDLIDVNQLVNPDILAVGTSLKIPGLEGVSGELTTVVTPLGVNLTRLSRANQISIEKLIKLNRITSPNEIYAGSTLIIPQSSDDPSRAEVVSIAEGQSTLEYALTNNANPWVAAAASLKSTPSDLIPGEPIYSAAGATGSRYWGSPLIQDIQVSPLPLVQGKTITIRVSVSTPVSASGDLNSKPLTFFPESEGVLVALQGVHALAEPGLASFSLTITPQDGNSFTLEQQLLLESGYYPNDPSLYVDPQTIDTAVTGPEDELVNSVIGQITPDKLWEGMFQLPVDEPACIKSWYGNRRSYNGSPFTYFHTGVDYGVCANLNIYSPASGIVVFAGPLTVRGNATIIDHGRGVFSGIWHQKSIAVDVGDRIEQGQLIGEIGGTGRATGPHLHWEVWVNGVQVEPLDWLETDFPLSGK